MHRSKTTLAAGVLAALFAFGLNGCASAPSHEGIARVPQAAATPPRLEIGWRAAVGADLMWNVGPREYASPVYLRGTDEILTGSASGSLTKTRASDGGVVWNRHLEAGVHATPAVDGQVAFIGSMDGTIQAIHLHDGRELWSRVLRGSIETRPAVADGRLFVVDSQDVLHALDAVTGEPLWQYQRSAPEFFTIMGGGSPVVSGDTVYCGFSDGRLAALYVDSGDEAWVADLSGGKRELIDVDVAPIVMKDRVYAASYSGGVYALDREDGLVLWRHEAESVADIKLVGANVLIASAVGRVQSVRSSDASVQWSLRLRENSPVSLAAIGPYAFVSTAGGGMYILDLFSGHALIQWDPSNGFNTSVVTGGERAYALSNGGYLYGFKLAF